MDVSEIGGFSAPSGRLTCETEEREFLDFVKELIGLIGEIIGIGFQRDGLLRENLFLYLRSAVERLRYSIHVTNTLLPEIKAEYPNIFAAVWSQAC